MTVPIDITARLSRLAGHHGLLLAAVSGGADSVALARLLKLSGADFHIATMDHCIRPDSDADAAFVAELGAVLQIPVHTERLDVPGIAGKRGWNLEDAARRLRYRWLFRIAREIGATHVITAHTRSDQAETVLMQLLRGATWLTGMKAASGMLLRPILTTAGTELRSWLSDIGQEWLLDQTNLDTSFTRAWLRHELLPLLEKRFPGTESALGTLALLQQDQKDFVGRAAKPFAGNSSADAELLARQHPALQREVIAQLLREKSAPISFERIERIRHRLDRAEPWRESLSDGTAVRIAYGVLDVHESSARPESEVDTVPEPVNDTAALPDGVSDAALRYPELVLRSRRPGDRIRLQGGSRKLSDLLIDRKVAREDRDSLRILASGSTVLWVEGVAIASDVGSGAVPDSDSDHMRAALEQARLAESLGELPVGAVIVRDGKVLAAAHNETEATGDPTAHAEVIAIRRAAAVAGSWRLEGCTVYVTLEPCPMCFGAIQQAHLAEVVYGAINRREGAFGGVAFLNAHDWKRRPRFRRGPMAKEAGALLKAFFARRRRPV